jgi:hypothetical protein
MLGRRGSVQSIIRAFPYLSKGCIVILAAVAIITSGLSVATTSSASSEGSPANEDRTHPAFEVGAVQHRAIRRPSRD